MKVSPITLYKISYMHFKAQNDGILTSTSTSITINIYNSMGDCDYVLSEFRNYNIVLLAFCPNMMWN